MTDSPLARALACPYTAMSFARLDAHWQAGKFDPGAALRLLSRNARDHTDTGRETLARQLLAHWQARYATAAEIMYFDGAPLAHVVMYEERLRLARRMDLCNRAIGNR